MVEFCYLRLNLGIETVSRRLLLQIARMDIMDLGQLSFSSYNAMPAPKNYYSLYSLTKSVDG